MTSPGHNAPLPSCTDYSSYTLDELWDMVSAPDTISQSQITGWLQMAILCEEQADGLTKALERLAAYWPPTPGSASEAFSSFVRGVLHILDRNAVEARQMSRCLSGIVAALESARSQMQPLVELQGHYCQLPPSDTRAVEFTFLAPVSQRPSLQPPGWREDLHAHATAILDTADATVDDIAAAMPVVTALRPSHIDVDDGTSNDPPPDGDTAIPRGTSGIPMTLSPIHLPRRPADPAAGAPATSNPPTLTGAPSPTPEVGHPGDQAVLAPPLPSSAMPAGTIVGSVVARILPVDGVIGRTTPGSGVGNTSTASLTTPVRQASGEPMMSPSAVAGRAPLVAGRPGIRPGGRAALWASQRRNKDPRDPWSVRQGVPAVIEPAAAPEHDPGPGVIGLDR